MEQIYTIPVNEAFDETAEKHEFGCPLCLLYRKLQNDEIDIILGASMMEPDIRIKTNDMGFCHSHYGMMLRRKRMLGMGLILESHLAEVKNKLNGKGSLISKTGASMKELSRLNSECYVCSRIDKNLLMMIATTVYLFETDTNFKAKLKRAPYFCIPHYEATLSYAEKKMSKKAFKELYEAMHEVNENYITNLSSDVSWFCKKFDYRYDEEPWYNAKDSVYRSIKFLSGELGQDE